MLRRENKVRPNSLVFFMRVNEQETAHELAEWREGGVMDGRGLKRQPPEGEPSVRTNARFIHLSFLMQSLLW